MASESVLPMNIPDARSQLIRKDPNAGKGEGDDRGWDAWMISPTQRAWVWANSASRWRTGKPGVLQTVGRDWATGQQRGFPGGSVVKNPPANTGENVGSTLGQKDTLEEQMATHSSILACRIPRTEEPGRLHSTGSQIDMTDDWPTKHADYIRGRLSSPLCRRTCC